MKKANEMAKITEEVKAQRLAATRDKAVDFIEKHVAPAIEDAANKGFNVVKFQKDSAIDNECFQTYLEENGYTTSFAHGMWTIEW